MGRVLVPGTMAETSPILELLDVSKSYGTVLALASTSLEVARGRTTVLIGPSGCGKTTLLRLMIGLIRPDTGQVLFRSSLLAAHNVQQARAGMGYVVQDGGLFPHLTAERNVSLMARELGWGRSRINERMAGLADLVRLPTTVLSRTPAEMSGGQRQRVGLMRALMLDPQLLLLDEPLGALDPLVRADLQDDLADVFRKLAKSVVLVTHDLAEAAFFGHTIVLLHDGRTVQRGSIEDLLRRPIDPFVTRFVKAQRTLQVPPPENPG
jgi:osmoprotectant transport system ATP-binding protein